MERTVALAKINKIIGEDLRVLAKKFDVTVTKNGKPNKGWAGHTIERHLGLALNSSRAPNFGSWELKVVPLKRSKKRGIRVKETMAICMIDPVEVKAKEFKDSHLYAKLCKILVVARMFEDKTESRACVYKVATFDLDNPEVYATVKADYDLVRNTLKTRGFAALGGKMGVLVQPRTKGPGHGSTSRAFYARTKFVAHILGLDPY